MVPTEARPRPHTGPPLIALSQCDIDAAMELSIEAGWNQTTDDWQLFLNHGAVFGVVEEGALCASAAIMPYGADFAWISMVLTRKSKRGCGLGTRLLKHCLSLIDAQGRTAVLDATPAGEVIYRKLGFDGDQTFTRWKGTGGGKPPCNGSASDTANAILVVNRAFGADRTNLLANFARRRLDLCHYDPDNQLCAFGRDGRLATQIGPVVGTSPISDSPETEALIAALIGTTTGPVLIDVADHCTRLCARLEALGFEKQRSFLRMKRGPWLPPENGSTIVVIAGPEFG